MKTLKRLIIILSILVVVLNVNAQETEKNKKGISTGNRKYLALESTIGEVMYSSTNFKMGRGRIHVIFKIGSSYFKGKSVFIYGLGLGTKINLNEKQSVNFDLSSSQLAYRYDWDSGLNMLHKLDINYKIRLTERLSLLVGPSFNLYLTRVKVENQFGTVNIPYTIFTNEQENQKLFSWIGFKIGTSLRLSK